ncbi:hypothetical protein V2J09_003813 [Rumex salicifolius]
MDSLLPLLRPLSGTDACSFQMQLAGFPSPTPIQAQSWPICLQGRDIMHTSYRILSIVSLICVSVFGDIIKGVENLKITARIGMWKQKNINRREDVQLIFIDEKGSRIEATIPSFFVNRFGPKLNEYLVITVSKFGVEENSDQWRVAQHPYKIIFFYSTFIDECSNCSISRMGIEFVKFEPIIFGQIEENTCVNGVGEVIEYKDLTNVAKEDTQPKLKLEIKLANEEAKVLNYTLYCQYAEQMSKHINSCKEDRVIVIIVKFYTGIGSESKLPSITHVSTIIATSKEEIFFNPTFKQSLVETDEALEMKFNLALDSETFAVIEYKDLTNLAKEDTQPKLKLEIKLFYLVNSSYLWANCKVLRLPKNMRSHAGEASIQIPANLLIKETTNLIASITEAIYPFVADRLSDGKYFEERTILAPTLEVVEKVNDYIMSLLPGEEKVYFSFDSISQIDGINQDDEDLYSVEYLNSIKLSSIPNHCLRLKINLLDCAMALDWWSPG